MNAKEIAEILHETKFEVEYKFENGEQKVIWTNKRTSNDRRTEEATQMAMMEAAKQGLICSIRRLCDGRNADPKTEAQVLDLALKDLAKQYFSLDNKTTVKTRIVEEGSL